MEDQYQDSRERLLYVIRLSGLNGKEFAAKVNVSPSTISQITSTSDKARKTGLSEMVVNKILSAFPQFNLSYEWLLNGIGPKSVQQKQPSLFDIAEQVNDSVKQFTSPSDATSQAADSPDGGNNVKQVNAENVNVNSQHPSGDASNLQQVIMPPYVNDGAAAPAELHENGIGAPAPNASTYDQNQVPPRHDDDRGLHAQYATPGGPSQAYEDQFPRPQQGVSVERIVIFYSDGTFADYSPRRGR